jgi:hypothetical protein
MAFACGFIVTGYAPFSIESPISATKSDLSVRAQTIVLTIRR